MWDQRAVWLRKKPVLSVNPIASRSCLHVSKLTECRRAMNLRGYVQGCVQGTSRYKAPRSFALGFDGRITQHEPGLRSWLGLGLASGFRWTSPWRFVLRMRFGTLDTRAVNKEYDISVLPWCLWPLLRGVGAGFGQTWTSCGSSILKK